MGCRTVPVGLGCLRLPRRLSPTGSGACVFVVNAYNAGSNVNGFCGVIYFKAVESGHGNLDPTRGREPKIECVTSASHLEMREGGSQDAQLPNTL